VEVAAISVDPPDHNARMRRKLLLPFPLLSDPRGDLARRYGLWNAEEGVAVPAIVVIDRTGEVCYLYAGGDFADRPGDEEIFAALDGLEATEKHGLSGPEVVVSAAEAENSSVRPDKPPMPLEQLGPYYRGVYFATIALKKRFGSWGGRGRDAFKEVGRYQAIITGYREAIRRTVELHEGR
jgi:hypothetical protein